MNRLLCDWAERRRPCESHLRDLQSRIVNRVAGLPTRGRPDTDAGPVVVPFRIKLGYAALGAAAALVLSLGLPGWLQPAAGNGSARRLATITHAERREENRLFTEMERLFDDRLRWIVESDGDVGLGVESIPGGTDDAAAPVLVRFVLAARQPGQSGWDRIWGMDLLLRGEEIARIAPNPSSGNRLTLWVYPMTDGQIVVDTDAALDAPVRLASRSSTVLKQGEPSELARLRVNDAEYRLYQTAVLLDRDGRS